MRSRGHVLLNDTDMGSVFGALKRRVRWLVAASLILGISTYGALSLVAPRSLGNVTMGWEASIGQSFTGVKSLMVSNAVDFPWKGALAALVTLASLMFGTVWIAAAALLRAPRKRSLTHPPQPQSAKSADLRSDPALPPHSEPPRRDIESGETPALQEAVSPAPITTISAGDVSALLSRLFESRRPDSGYRTLLTGACEGIDATAEAIELVNALARRGAQVILIDWDSTGKGMAPSIDLDRTVGLNDLLCGDANFGEIIQRLPGTSVHAIASGKALELSPETVDPDRLNLILDALDEAYDHIVVTGRHDEARKLFETIEGRFDTGIIVVEHDKDAPVLSDMDGTFLGFEVANIDIIHFERRPSMREPVHQRIARVARRRPLELAGRA
jgi:Mrp family chromosome partitioning ATPase